MKHIPKLMSAFVVLFLIYLVMTGTSLHGLDGLEDGIIKDPLTHSEFFVEVARMKYITITTNLVGLLIITILFRATLKSNSEQDI